jgi:hypothetical protein
LPAESFATCSVSSCLSRFMAKSPSRCAFVARLADRV